MLDANAADAFVRQIFAWASPLLSRIVKALLRPAAPTTLIGSVMDLTRSKSDQIAENLLLRHQLALLKRQTKRPRLTTRHRWSVREVIRYPMLE